LFDGTAPRTGLSRKDVCLLRAALLDGPVAAVAFAAWREGIDLADIDYGWSRLLPLVQRNLARQGIDDPWMDRMRGIRRMYWARNLKLLHRVAPVLRRLGAANVPVVLLKGAAMLATEAETIDLRPMDDVDIMVPPDRIAEAVALLDAEGWTPQRPLPCAPDALAELTETAGWPFAGPDGTELDLHWRALNLDGRVGSDQGFWDRAQPAHLGGEAALVLSPADQLLHVCVHAVYWAGFSSLRWAADAALILRAAGDRVDWTVLVAEARRRRFATVMHDSLQLLARELAVPVPRPVLRELGHSARYVERIEARISRDNPLTRGITRRLLAKFVDIRRNDPALAVRGWFHALGPFLRFVLEARSAGALPGLVLFQLLRRPAWLRGVIRVDSRLRSRCAHRPPGEFAPARAARLGAIDLSGGASCAALLGWWSFADAGDGGRWTTGPEARVLWDVAGAQGYDLCCQIDAEGFVAAGHPGPTVAVYANDRVVAPPRRIATMGEIWRFTIPRATFQGVLVLCLTFDIRNLRAPAMAGDSPDGRLLGLLVRTIAMRRATEYEETQ
jgi:hypothetical protein